MPKPFAISKIIPQATIIHHIDEDEGIWATKNRRIIYGKNGRWREIAQFPLSYPQDLFGFSRPTSRAFRSDKCNLYQNQSGRLFGIRAGIAYKIAQGKTFKLFDIQGDCVLHGSIGEDPYGNIYFGEYFMNPERKAVRIWRVDQDLASWRVAAELKNIRHIHGIYQDTFNPQFFWVTVGDFEGECFILRTADFFKTFDWFGDGSQIWRAVRLFFSEESINWLTDSNIEQNYACRMRRNDLKLEVGHSVDTSTWYGCQTGEGLYVAFTTVERGPAIQTNESSILISKDAFHWKKIFGFRKDFWRPVQLFKYGVISCPSGIMTNKKIYVSGEGLVGLDGISLCASIDMNWA